MPIRTVTIEVKMDISNAEGKIASLTVSMKGLGDEVKKTGKSTDDFERLVTKNMKDGENAFQALTRKSKELHSEIDTLKRSFGSSTSGSAGKSILGDLGSAENDLKKVKSFLSNMTEEGHLAGHSFGDGFSKEFILSFRTVPEFLASPIGGTLAAVLAPALIAGVAAAITAGIGLGVVGIGAAIESQDPRIKAAFVPIKTDIENVFKESAAPLVQPILSSLGQIDQWVKSEKPAFTNLFASVAPSVGLIAKNIETLIGDLVPALTKVGRTFTTVFKSDEVQQSLGQVSAAFANIFTTIGNNPKEVADGILFLNGVLKGTFGLLSDIFNIVGPLVADLRQLRSVSDEYGKTIDANTAKQAAHDKAIGDTGVHYYRLSTATADATAANQAYAAAQAAAASAAIAAGPDFVALAKTLQGTTVTASTLAGQLTDKVVGGMLAADNANNNFNKSLVTVGDTIVALGGNLTQHVKALKKTETGQQQETDAVLAAIQANLQVYDSQIAVGISASDAARAYDKNAASLEAQVKSAGKVPQAVQKLIDKYAKVPDSVNTAITIKGLTEAINNLDDTLRLINHLDGRHATVTVTTVFRTKGHPPSGPLARNISATGGVYEHAADGVLSGATTYSAVNPGRYMIAEPSTGGEAFIPKYGDWGRGMSILSAAAGWYGASVVSGFGSSYGGGGAVVNIWASDPQAKALLAGMRFVVQQNGGNPVQVLTPR